MDEPDHLHEPSRPAEEPPRGQAASATPADAPNLSAILSIPVTVQVVLGSTSLPVSSLMKLVARFN